MVLLHIGCLQSEQQLIPSHAHSSCKLGTSSQEKKQPVRLSALPTHKGASAAAKVPPKESDGIPREGSPDNITHGLAGIDAFASILLHAREGTFPNGLSGRGSLSQSFAIYTDWQDLQEQGLSSECKIRWQELLREFMQQEERSSPPKPGQSPAAQGAANDIQLFVCANLSHLLTVEGHTEVVRRVELLNASSTDPPPDAGPAETVPQQTVPVQPRASKASAPSQPQGARRWRPRQAAVMASARISPRQAVQIMIASTAAEVPVPALSSSPSSSSSSLPSSSDARGSAVDQLTFARIRHLVTMGQQARQLNERNRTNPKSLLHRGSATSASGTGAASAAAKRPSVGARSSGATRASSVASFNAAGLPLSSPPSSGASTMSVPSVQLCRVPSAGGQDNASATQDGIVNIVPAATASKQLDEARWEDAGGGGSAPMTSSERRRRRAERRAVRSLTVQSTAAPASGKPSAKVLSKIASQKPLQPAKRSQAKEKPLHSAKGPQAKKDANPAPQNSKAKARRKSSATGKRESANSWKHSSSQVAQSVRRIGFLHDSDDWSDSDWEDTANDGKGKVAQSSSRRASIVRGSKQRASKQLSATMQPAAERDTAESDSVADTDAHPMSDSSMGSGVVVARLKAHHRRAAVSSSSGSAANSAAVSSSSGSAANSAAVSSSSGSAANKTSNAHIPSTSHSPARITSSNASASVTRSEAKGVAMQGRKRRRPAGGKKKNRRPPASSQDTDAAPSRGTSRAAGQADAIQPLPGVSATARDRLREFLLEGSKGRFGTALWIEASLPEAPCRVFLEPRGLRQQGVSEVGIRWILGLFRHRHWRMQAHANESGSSDQSANSQASPSRPYTRTNQGQVTLGKSTGQAPMEDDTSSPGSPVRQKARNGTRKGDRRASCAGSMASSSAAERPSSADLPTATESVQPCPVNDSVSFESSYIFHFKELIVLTAGHRPSALEIGLHSQMALNAARQCKLTRLEAQLQLGLMTRARAVPVVAGPRTPASAASRPVPPSSPGTARATPASATPRARPSKHSELRGSPTRSRVGAGARSSGMAASSRKRDSGGSARASASSSNASGPLSASLILQRAMRERSDGSSASGSSASDSAKKANEAVAVAAAAIAATTPEFQPLQPDRQAAEIPFAPLIGGQKTSGKQKKTGRNDTQAGHSVSRAPSDRKKSAPATQTAVVPALSAATGIARLGDGANTCVTSDSGSTSGSRRGADDELAAASSATASLAVAGHGTAAGGVHVSSTDDSLKSAGFASSKAEVGPSVKSTREPVKARSSKTSRKDAKPTSGSRSRAGASSKPTPSVSRSLESTFLSIDYIQKEVNAAKGANGLGQKRSRPDVSATASGSIAPDRSTSNESAASSLSSGFARGFRGRALGGSLPLELAQLGTAAARHSDGSSRWKKRRRTGSDAAAGQYQRAAAGEGEAASPYRGHVASDASDVLMGSYACRESGVGGGRHDDGGLASAAGRKEAKRGWDGLGEILDSLGGMGGSH